MISTRFNLLETLKLSIKPLELLVLFLTFLGIALFQVWLDDTSFYMNVGTDPYYHLIFSKFISNPDLYQRDPVFHHHFYQARAFIAYPIFLYLLNLATHTFSFFQALNLFQVVFSMLYLSSATFFLYKFSNRLWPSTLIACLSARQTPVFPTEQWGTLSAALVIPGTFFLVFSPVIFWAWLQFKDRMKEKRLVFFCLGILGNLHPLSWYTMTFSLLFAQLIQGRFKRSVIADALVCAALAFLPMIPFALFWFGTKKVSELPVAHYQETLAGIYMLFQSLKPETLTSGLLTGLLADFGWIVLTGWAIAKIWQRIPKLVLYFALGGILLFLASYALNQWYLIPHQKELFLDGSRTLKFLFLPMILILTLWLSEFKRTGLMVRSALVVFLVIVFNAQLFWTTVQKNPFDIPSHIYAQWAAFTVSRNPMEFLQQENIYQAGEWMKQHVNSAQSRIFISYPVPEVSHMLRALGDVSVTFAKSDGGLIYLSDPKHFVEWYHLYSDLNKLHADEGFCSPVEIKLARHLKSTHIICPSWIFPKNLSKQYRNEMLTLWKL